MTRNADTQSCVVGSGGVAVRDEWHACGRRGYDARGLSCTVLRHDALYYVSFSPETLGHDECRHGVGPPQFVLQIKHYQYLPRFRPTNTCNSARPRVAVTVRGACMHVSKGGTCAAHPGHSPSAKAPLLASHHVSTSPVRRTSAQPYWLSGGAVPVVPSLEVSLVTRYGTCVVVQTGAVGVARTVAHEVKI